MQTRLEQIAICLSIKYGFDIGCRFVKAEYASNSCSSKCSLDSDQQKKKKFVGLRV